MTNVFELIAQGDREGLARFVRDGSADLRSANDRGVTPLAFAAYNHDHEAVALLRQAQSELTPFEACIVGDVQRLQDAIKEGWDPNELSPDGFAPLALTAFFQQGEAFDLLLPVSDDLDRRAENVQQVGAIHAAAAVNDNRILEALLARGANPDVPQAAGVTPLHVTAARGNFVGTGLLLLFGATRDPRDERGHRPVDLAARAGHDLLTALLSRQSV